VYCGKSRGYIKKVRAVRRSLTFLTYPLDFPQYRCAALLCWY